MKLLLLGFAILFSSVIGMGFIENVDALKSKGNPVTSYGSSSGVCGDKLCSEIEPKKSKKSDYMKMESEKSMMSDDEMMMNKDVSNNYISVDLSIKSKIKAILDQTDYSLEVNTEIISELSNYLSTINESKLQQQTMKKIIDIVFYAEHDQIPLEFAIYDIYQILE